MLGLCRKSGKLIPGAELIAKNKKKCLLLVCACDASDRTKATVEAFNIKTIHTDMTKQELGAALGMGNVAVVGITDAGFAAATESKQGKEHMAKYKIGEIAKDFGVKVTDVADILTKYFGEGQV